MTDDWVMFVAPGKKNWGWVKSLLIPEHVTDVQESPVIQGSDMILVSADVLSEIDDPPPVYLQRPAVKFWPDGQPVTPWADPWHDVAGDLRRFKADAYAHRDDPNWPEPLVMCRAHADDCPNGPYPHEYIPDNDTMLPCCLQPWEED
jgi:hypothetical protein